MRMVRATMLEVLSLDYVRTARAKGVPRRTVIRKHALRNALIPVVTVVGFEVGVLIGGAAIVEIIFGLPGVGYTLLHAIFQRDYPMIQAATLLIAAVFVVVNFVVDILYGCLDPRISDRDDATDREGVWKALPERRRLALPARWRNPIGIAGAVIVGCVILTALFGRFIWTVDPNNPASTRLLGPSWAHPMGTDEIGRDTLARDHPRRAGLAPGRRGRDLDRVRLRDADRPRCPASTAARSTSC